MTIKSSRKGYLAYAENGKEMMFTLSTSHYHANNIIIDFLLRKDPFRFSK